LNKSPSSYPNWLRGLQIAVGTISIIFSVIVIVYPIFGSYTTIVLSKQPPLPHIETLSNIFIQDEFSLLTYLVLQYLPLAMLL
jgi:hypothetical protein